MKVVLFCGGLGMRLREYSDQIPKPMVPIGYRPIIWHLMKYYAHIGHKDFILCLGHKADVIKRYFLDYDPLTTARRVKVPTLILQGATDQQVTAEQAASLERAMRARGNRRVTRRVFAEANHLFVQDPDGN